MVSQWTRESNSKFDICRRGILRPESRRRGGGLVRFPAANASIATKSPLKPRRSPQNDALSPPTSSPQSHRNYTTDGAKHPSSTICGALSAIHGRNGPGWDCGLKAWWLLSDERVCQKTTAAGTRPRVLRMFSQPMPTPIHQLKSRCRSISDKMTKFFVATLALPTI